ncbi:MAG: ypdA 5 [Bacteroidetes bacterium]|jgi:sensor histidine kinase YesM/ligand-binding sensor domain-containing protein|nr:ypdA 5 [Bacteroidota bacterium]
MKWSYPIAVVFFLCFFSVRAQQVVMKNYGTADGLPSSECYWVMQDSRHFLWVATDAGVVKYDGYQFTTYTSRHGLPDNTVFKIHEDRHGRVWFSTYSGKFAYYLHETDSIYTIPANEDLTRAVKLLPFDFTFDEKDTLWVSLQMGGYIKIFPPFYQKNIHERIPHNGFFLKELGNGSFIYGNDRTEGQNILWVPLYYIPEKKNVSESMLTGHINSFSSLLSAISYKHGYYLFSNGASVFDLSGDTAKELLSFGKKGYAGIIINIFKDSKSRIWLGTQGQGVFLYENEKLARPHKQLLKNNNVSCVFEDADHGYWFATTTNGLYFVPSLKFNYYNSDDGLSSNKVYTIGAYDNKLYSVTSDIKLNVLNLQTKEISSKADFRANSPFLLGQKVYINVDNRKSFLVNETTGIRTELTCNGAPIFLKKLIESDSGFLAGFSTDSRVFEIEEKTGKARMMGKVPAKIFTIYKNGDELLLGTKQGLCRLKNDKLFFMADNLPMLGCRINGITGDQKILFLATAGFGVLCYKDNKIVYQFNESNGLASNICRCILKDSKGSIWVGTNRGLSQLVMSPEGQYRYRTLNTLNGLESNEINQIIEYKEHLYLATNGGIVVIDINDPVEEVQAIPVYIEKFEVNNTVYDHKQPQQFTHNENFVKINYKGIFLRNEGDITYKYKLTGLDTSWTYSKNTFVQFTTLPAGDYTFIVYAVSANKSRMSEPATIRFTIQKAVWKTVWFIFPLIVFILGALYLLYRSRISKIEKKEKEKILMNKRVHELEMKALRSQMNPHFIFNSMNSIQNFIIKNESVIAQKYLTKFSRLIRAVLENSKHESILLSKEIEMLNLYLELESLRASHLFSYEIKMENMPQKNIYLPTMLIQPYVENAILHGLLPLQERSGKLTVTFSGSDTFVICKIEDNGIGRTRARAIKRNKALNHESMGMSVTGERISNMNKHGSSQVDMFISDKYEGKEATGTIILIKIHI